MTNALDARLSHAEVAKQAAAGAAKTSPAPTRAPGVSSFTTNFGKHNVFYGWHFAEAADLNMLDPTYRQMTNGSNIAYKAAGAVAFLFSAVVVAIAAVADIVKGIVATCLIVPAYSVITCYKANEKAYFSDLVDFSHIKQVEVQVKTGANVVNLMGLLGKAESAFANASEGESMHDNNLSHADIQKTKRDLQATRKAVVESVVNNTPDAAKAVRKLEEHQEDLRQAITTTGKGSAFYPNSQHHVDRDLVEPSMGQLKAAIFEPVIDKFKGQLNADLRLSIRNAKMKDSHVDAFLSTVNGLPKIDPATGEVVERTAEEGTAALSTRMQSADSQAALKIAAKEVESVLAPKGKNDKQSAYETFVADKKAVDEKRRAALDAQIKESPKALIDLLNAKVKCDIGEGFTKTAGKVVTEIEGLGIAEGSTFDVVETAVEAKITQLEAAIDSFEENNKEAIRVIKLAQHNPEEFTRENLDKLEGFINYVENCKLYFRLTRDTTIGYRAKQKANAQAKEDLRAVVESLETHDATCAELIKGRVALIQRFAPETQFSDAVKEFVGGTVEETAEDSSVPETAADDSSIPETQPDASEEATGGAMDDFDSLNNGTESAE